MAEIIQLGDLGEEDKTFADFIEEVKKDGTTCVFYIVKEDGTVAIGSNFDDRKDLVFNLYRLNSVIEMIIKDGD